MNKAALLATMAASTGLAAGQAPLPAPDFVAASVAHRGTLHVDAPPAHAFQLFTAPGETLWVPGWDPLVLKGGDGRERDAVFLTTHHEERTIWLVVDYDPGRGYARYARIVPCSRAGTVEVFVRPESGGGSEVEIRYELVALSEDGNRSLQDFDAGAFDAMLAEWERTIRAAQFEYPLDLRGSGRGT